MKNTILISSAILLSFFIVYFTQDHEVFPNQPNDYHIPREFNFIAIHDKDDPFFNQKIHSMINQDYNNYQIYIVIKKEDQSIAQDLLIYAQKAAKSHLCKVIELDSKVPLLLLINDLIKTFHRDSLTIHLRENCTFLDNNLLNTLNSIYQQDSSALVYSNYINYPSFQKNKSKQNFSNSHFKCFCSNQLLNNFTELTDFDLTQGIEHLVHIDPKHTYYIDEALYLRLR
ncbi:MAG: hypothetical protein S4CHLAM20_05760 [Chlamydiia bacterium]|nr:hypothetical protein [Chlamydiia bacterium]